MISNIDARTELQISKNLHMIHYAADIRRKAWTMTQAVGRIVDDPQADAILNEGSADFIATGLETLHNPFLPLQKAPDMSSDANFQSDRDVMADGWTEEGCHKAVAPTSVAEAIVPLEAIITVMGATDGQNRDIIGSKFTLRPKLY